MFFLSNSKLDSDSSLPSLPMYIDTLADKPPSPPPTSTLRRGLGAFSILQRLWKVDSPHPDLHLHHVVPPKILQTSQERLESGDPKTVLYLAYGSNLSAETFKGTRGIKPISSINVHCPTLTLTFDLPGMPYVEPCFANTKFRDPTSSPPTNTADYHKDRWHKGLIGAVYEVTPEDFRTIIATEGGGASYQDIIIPCYAIPPNTTKIDPLPKGPSFLAHTLLQPRVEGARYTSTGRIQRPDPSYAQPSARYLKLITDGGEEHNLPSEYLHFLYNIRPYTITTYKQTIGKAIFVMFWFPLVMLFFMLGRVLADKKGRIPKWLVGVMGVLFATVWGSYDVVFKRGFGDGERTMGGKGKGKDEEGQHKSVGVLGEKGNGNTNGNGHGKGVTLDDIHGCKS